MFVFVCLYFSCLSAQEAAMSQWGPPLVNNIQRCIETTQDALTLNGHAVTAIADKSISLPQQPFSGICVSVSVYICSTLNCHAVPANADESVSVSLAQRDDPKQ